MKRRINPWVKGSAIILLILSCISGLLTLISINIIPKLTDINTYKVALVNSRTYQRLPGIISEQIVNYLKSTTCRNDSSTCAQIVTDPVIKVFIDSTPQARQAFAQIVLKPDFLQSQVEKTLDEILQPSSNKKGYIDLIIPLHNIAEIFHSEVAFEAFNDLIRSLEPCTYQEMKDLGLDVPNHIHISKLPYCHVPEWLYKISVVQKNVHEAYDASLQYVPDQFHYRVQIPENGMVSNYSQLLFSDGSDIINMIAAQYMWLILSALFLTIVSILTVRDLSDFLIWWGIPILVTGLLGFIAIAIARLSITTYVLPELYLSTMGKLVLEVQVLIRDIINEIENQLSEPIIIQSGILFAAGLIMILCNVVFRKRLKKSVKKSNP